MLLGFDPGQDKCGLAVMSTHSTIHYKAVVSASEAIATVVQLVKQYAPTTIIMGDQTTSKTWKARLEIALQDQPEIQLPPAINMVDERYSTLEARDRYWQIHPPKGIQRVLPQSLRTITRPIDDIVAVILIERYLMTASPPSSARSP